MIKHNKNMKDLVSFQSDNKYLFMAYNQVKQKELGRIIANHKMKRLKLYLKTMRRLYMNYLCAPRYTSNVNVCEHILDTLKQS